MEEVKGKREVNNKKLIIIIASVVFAIILVAGGIFIKIKKEKEEQERYNNLPVKVEYKVTSYYGTIEYILYELGLDFDLVTAGANCYTGVVKNEYKTKKYGVLHTEFRYCKSNRTMTFRVYNDDSDQELREPKTGEIPEFDEYGKKVDNKDKNL